HRQHVFGCCWHIRVRFTLQSVISTALDGISYIRTVMDSHTCVPRKLNLCPLPFISHNYSQQNGKLISRLSIKYQHRYAGSFPIPLASNLTEKLARSVHPVCILLARHCSLSTRILKE